MVRESQVWLASGHAAANAAADAADATADAAGELTTHFAQLLARLLTELHVVTKIDFSVFLMTTERLSEFGLHEQTDLVELLWTIHHISRIFFV